MCSMLVLYENHIKGASYVNYMKHTYGFIKRKIYSCAPRKKGISALDKIYLYIDEVRRCMHNNRTSGLLGREKTIQSIKSKFYWPGMSDDIGRWYQTC